MKKGKKLRVVSLDVGNETKVTWQCEQHCVPSQGYCSHKLEVIECLYYMVFFWPTTFKII